MVELKYIEAFLKIVETGSFSAASEQLYISQPSISVRIQQLEKELKKPLFTRVEGKKVKLTTYGEKVFPYFKEAYKLIQQGCVALDNELEQRKINISCPNHMGMDIMPEILGTLYSDFPSLEFAVNIFPKNMVQSTIDGIQRHEVDIGFIYSTHEAINKYREFDPIHIVDEKNILVCSPDHRLAKKNRICVGELMNERIIIYDRDLLSTKIIESFLENNQLSDYKKVEIDNLSWIKMMVQKGLGVAFLQHNMVKEDLGRGTLVEISLEELLPQTSIYILFGLDLTEEIKQTIIKTTKTLFGF
ncbi:LysR family transcriptional regulator [Bacillus sp. Marseille-P3661]|uniref:LysR family transcriptional regulator n=1 Tax=Bacillus sp. Marseille-P3661 TaxID=1936234 RepID=UPI000C8592A5|nr:LysR family transcriptional regulator [Bacillus sp. Marseille-P3661]